ncbi:MFS transporter [Nocardioides cavernaquae]|uniref:MFS transporter n=1 Tax=Nocardioides cavernaquae TaxID=2321396 RepID=A0A3A5HGU6_9ACTN|nr:MFS transporter [Nocardioides cavernaquae]RJS47294.1 MFS transporter [Nocardioides cavernaquae]
MTEPTAVSSASTDGRANWSPWRTIVAFGFVSMAADMVYEGMRSISGPYLASLGASAAMVGLVTGAGEAIALILRLVAGPFADRTHRYWTLTIVGYGMTAVCVPLLAVAPLLGGAGLAVASTLILLERTGKAIRSPSKSALLALAAKDVGRGKGFGVHKSMDQVGAFAGPLVIAAAAALSGHLWLGLALLAIPGAISMVLLLQTRAHAPLVEEQAPSSGLEVTAAGRLPWRFHAFAVATSVGTGGLMTYGVIGFHLVDADLLSAASTPVVYAGAMAVAAVAALGTGVLYDRFHEKVLYLLPVLVACVPALVFADALWPVLVGVAVWGAATGIQDSTVKALVADLVARPRLGTAYGVFAAYQGVAALLGGWAAGALHQEHRMELVTGIAALQLLALVLLVVTLSRRPAPAA